MWNIKDIIKIEVGKGIVKAANSPDNRNYFIKLLGKEKEDDGKLLIQGAQGVRNALAKRGITLPIIRFTDNDSIKFNEFICYWGIEKGHYSIENISDLFDFIYNKAIEYSYENRDNSLDESIHFIDKDRFQEAYDNYIKTYYNARQKDNFYVMCRCLTETSALLAQDGQLDLAVSFSKSAIDISDGCNIVDKTLKCQCLLNAAGVIKYKDANIAISYLNKCSEIAYKTNNSYFLFMALIEKAEIFAYHGKYESAIGAYKGCLSLSDNSNFTNAIQKRMIALYQEIITEYKYKLTENKPSNKGLIHEIHSLIKTIIKDVAVNMGTSMIFKSFGIDGRFMSIFSFGQKINLSGNKFNGVTCIGDGNIINK